jgi:DNA-nicking Smr family endonuclease
MSLGGQGLMSEHTNNEDEFQLFLDAVRDVKRIEHRLADLSPKRLRTAPEPQARVVEQEPESSSSSITAETGFFRTGVQVSVLRKLRRGQIPIEYELDLHGYSSPEAEARLRGFLLAARSPERQTAVRIIHGKGSGSPGGKPVLKSKTQQWLRECDEVLAFCAAGPSEGGSGAVLVLLKKR